MADTHLRAIITAVDKLSPVLAKQSRMIRGWSRQFEKAGRGAVPMAAGLGAAMLIPAKAFMEAEDAATQLQNTLMTKDGLSSGFKQLSAVAVELGNKLPGTTADFMGMASQLKALGVDTDTLIGGALKASAYLAVVGKPLGVTYESAAESVGKLANAFGIAKQDLVPFADTIQRALHLGIDLTQLQYAMARVSGPLKAMGMQGIKVANDMVPLVSMLVQAGVSGEDAGTGIRSMINAQIAAGKFTGVKSLVADLESMDKLNPAAKMAKFTELFGEPHAGKASIIAAGGFGAMVKKMEEQASLQQRVNQSLGTLTNLWDAATGTFTNAMVAFATAYAPELKSLAQSINDISGKLITWATANGPAIRAALEFATLLVGVKLALYGVGVALALVARIAATNPFLLLVQAAAIAVPMIVAHWNELPALLGGLWDGIIQRWSYKIESFVGFISGVAKSITSIFSSVGNLLPSANGMSLPGQSIQRKPIVGNSGFKGSLDINHVNAPQGFRASPVQSKGPVRVQQNVGYNWQVSGH